jgi:hypothetical protein
MPAVPTTFELNYYSNEKAAGRGCVVESATRQQEEEDVFYASSVISGIASRHTEFDRK